jgi:hypothetical protein
MLPVLNAVPRCCCWSSTLQSSYHFSSASGAWTVLLTTTFCIVPVTHLEKLSICPKVRVQCKFQLAKNVDANNSSHRPIHLLVTAWSCVLFAPMLVQHALSIHSSCTHDKDPMLLKQSHFPSFLCWHHCSLAFWIFSGTRRCQVTICFHTNMNKNLLYPQV